MMATLLLLGGALLVILLAAELFTNALEHLGERLRISEGVTGSLLAAVGTALPETVVPILALWGSRQGDPAGMDIGVGAIVGAPLMLSTLTLALTGLAAIQTRGWQVRLQPEPGGLLRDIHFFLFAFAVAGLNLLLPPQATQWRWVSAVLLLLVYALYIRNTLRGSAALVAHGHATQAGEPMMLARLGLGTSMPVISVQLILALILLVLGAHLFIAGVNDAARLFGISTLLLSLVIIPIATELPEKINSVLWVRRGKDTLALGNVSGAMVFQGTVLPAIGMVATPWQPGREVTAAIVITLIATLWLRLLQRRSGIAALALAINGLLYAAYLGWVLRG